MEDLDLNIQKPLYSYLLCAELRQVRVTTFRYTGIARLLGISVTLLTVMLESPVFWKGTPTLDGDVTGVSLFVKLPMFISVEAQSTQALLGVVGSHKGQFHPWRDCKASRSRGDRFHCQI